MSNAAAPPPPPPTVLRDVPADETVARYMALVAQARLVITTKLREIRNAAVANNYMPPSLSTVLQTADADMQSQLDPIFAIGLHFLQTMIQCNFAETSSLRASGLVFSSDSIATAPRPVSYHLDDGCNAGVCGAACDTANAPVSLNIFTSKDSVSLVNGTKAKRVAKNSPPNKVVTTSEEQTVNAPSSAAATTTTTTSKTARTTTTTTTTTTVVNSKRASNATRKKSAAASSRKTASAATATFSDNDDTGAAALEDPQTEDFESELLQWARHNAQKDRNDATGSTGDPTLSLFD